MKNLTLIPTLLFAFNLSAQINNFYVENREIYWQKVYASDVSYDELINNIKESGKFQNIEFKINKISATTELIQADYKGAGYREMTVPIYISRSDIGGFVLIDIKDGKYRITFKNINFTQKYNDTLTKMGEQSRIKDYAVNRKGLIKPGFNKEPSVILNHTFTPLFEFKQTETSEDW